MKFGVREICDVVLKRKSAGHFGKLYLDKGMPVIKFDTLKTSSLEGTAETVYAQGGKGNPRLVAWEGDRTVTFTMEDALISPEGFSILSGAGFIDASEDQKIYVHTTEQVQIKNNKIELSKVPSPKGEMYIMLLNDDGSIDTSRVPMLIRATDVEALGERTVAELFTNWATDYNADARHQQLGLTVTAPQGGGTPAAGVVYLNGTDDNYQGSVIYVDYYVEAKGGVKQIEIEAGKFGGSYYLEASTLFRDQATGEDFPAEFVIPNCKVQSNFTFTMAPTGDPSTFTFTMDAFPDYTKFDKTKKVIAALQIVEDAELLKKLVAAADPDAGNDPGQGAAG